jgi:hypothetical protein
MLVPVLVMLVPVLVMLVPVLVMLVPVLVMLVCVIVLVRVGLGLFELLLVLVAFHLAGERVLVGVRVLRAGGARRSALCSLRTLGFLGHREPSRSR